ncbi:hypothetical protein Lser_V15G06560 [Lactuca serriola]
MTNDVENPQKVPLLPPPIVESKNWFRLSLWKLVQDWCRIAMEALKFLDLDGRTTVYIVDGSSQQPDYEFDAVRLDLEMFSPELAKKPLIVEYNKRDEGLGNESFSSHAIKAFKLLNESPSAHNVGASIASDPNVWNVVLKNEALVEFLDNHQSS